MNMLSNLFTFGIVLYGSMLAYLFFFQDKFIFYPPVADEAWYQKMAQYEYFIDTEEEKLHGWHYQNPDVEHTSIIYFGGNAEDVIYNLVDGHRYLAHQLFFTNLPGYGKSTGTPSEKSFYSNGLQVFDALVKRHQLDQDDVIVMGRSLGASVATYVAANRNTRGLILVTPFDSLENIAAEQFSWFPVRSMLRNKFKTTDYIQQVYAPIVIIGAAQDEIIPRQNLHNLQASVPDQSQLLMVVNSGHNTISLRPEYFDYINGFILASSVAAEAESHIR